MAQRRFLLLHGVEHHKPPGHWLYQLARALRDAGESVSYPQLPDADEPSLEHWRATLARELDALDVPDDEDAEAESVVVCHSLGCLLWLHHCARPAAHRRVDRVLLVAPPSPEILWPAVAAFRLPSDLDAVAVTAAARAGTRVVAGADDPYCPGGAQTVFAAPLRLDADVIAGGGHLSEADGYGPWPSMTRWCFDAAVRLRGNDVDPGAAGAGELDGKAGTGGGRLRNRGGLVGGLRCAQDRPRDDEQPHDLDREKQLLVKPAQRMQAELCVSEQQDRHERAARKDSQRRGARAQQPGHTCRA